MEKAVEIIRAPSIIEKELEKQKIEDPTKGALQAAEELLSQTAHAIINLTESLEETTEKNARSILLHRLEELGKLKEGYEEHYDHILRYRINWEDAMRALDDFKKWCDRVRPSLTDPEYQPTYKEMRDALEMIGIRVVVYQEGHKPRLQVEVSPPNIMSKFGIIVSKSASAF